MPLRDLPSWRARRHIVDSVTGARKVLTRVRGYMIGRSLSIGGDDAWYSYTETGTEGDIWIARIKK